MSYKLHTDVNRGMSDSFRYMVRDGIRYIEEKEIQTLKQQLQVAVDALKLVFSEDRFNEDYVDINTVIKVRQAIKEAELILRGGKG